MTDAPDKTDDAFDAWARADLLDLARSYVDCGFADEPERFMALIASGEPEGVARSMATHDSTCGLAARGWLGDLGLSDYRLRAPYRVGRVISDLVAMGREAGALFADARDAEPGDILVLGSPEHVLVVESIDGDEMSTIQGGERDPVHHAQQIQRMPRTLSGSGRATRVGGRPIEFCISLPPLARRFLP